MAFPAREFWFQKQRTDLWRVTEWNQDKVVDVRPMSPEQVGKKQTELIREGFTLHTFQDGRLIILTKG